MPLLHCMLCYIFASGCHLLLFTGVWVWKPATPYIPLDEKTQWKISMNTMADHVEYAIIRCNHQWAELLRENSGVQPRAPCPLEGMQILSLAHGLVSYGAW